jgi:hypothetical protein
LCKSPPAHMHDGTRCCTAPCCLRLHRSSLCESVWECMVQLADRVAARQAPLLWHVSYPASASAVVSLTWMASSTSSGASSASPGARTPCRDTKGTHTRWSAASDRGMEEGLWLVAGEACRTCCVKGSSTASCQDKQGLAGNHGNALSTLGPGERCARGPGVWGGGRRKHTSWPHVGLPRLI